MESQSDSVRAAVHCVLESNSCDEVMECVGPLAGHPGPQPEHECAPGEHVTHADGAVCFCKEDGHWDCPIAPENQPPHDSPEQPEGVGFECMDVCSVAASCALVEFDFCAQECASGVVFQEEIVHCLEEASHCNEVFFCLQAFDPAGLEPEGPEPGHHECPPGAVSPDGCVCSEDGLWMCPTQGGAGELDAECAFICEKVSECNQIPHEQCTQICVSMFAQGGVDPCFLQAESCEALDACSNPEAQQPVCEPGEMNADGCVCKEDGHWSCCAPVPPGGCSDEHPCEDSWEDKGEGYDEPSEPCDGTGMDCTGAGSGPGPGPGPADSFSCGDVDIERELMITDLSVVEDPARTFDGCDGTPMGAWTFGSLMTDMAGDEDPAEFTLNWLEQWTMDQELNGFVSPARLSIEEQVIQPWMARSGGEALDLAKAPFRLLAIVNRLDLRQTDEGGDIDAGEGRFVFGLVDVEAGCTPLEFVIIFEYGQRAETVEDIQDWAHAWHGLSAHEFGPDYNASLEAVTTAFTGAGADPSKPNGSSINQIRTNEIALDGPWELREFRVQPDGHLAQVSVKQEPGDGLKSAPELAEWINDNEEDVLASTHVVPAEMLGPAAAVTGLWAPVGVENPDARHSFALNTCSGCHQAETGAPFLHVGSRFAGEETPLSAFLVGGSTPDPVSGTMRHFNDLERRMLDLCDLVDDEAGEEAVHNVDIAPACSAN